jgi:prevent-host-death family protein
MRDMPEVISMHEAKSTLSKLVQRAAAGEPIYIGAYGRAVVKLVPVDANEKPARVIGMLKGKIHLPPDLEDPLPDEVIRLFEGQD